MQKGRGKKQAGLSLVVAALLIAFDQLSKSWIRANLIPGESFPESGFLRLTYVTNTGAVFGLLANQAALIIGITIASFIIVLLLFRYLPSATTLSTVAAGLILGGAAGNLMDRLRLGFVTDFIDIRLWGNFHWPAFNFADAAIVIGTAALAYFLIRSALLGRAREHNRKIRN
jgi:signal peptidase II